MLEWTCHIIAFSYRVSHIEHATVALCYYLVMLHLFVLLTFTCLKWLVFLNLSQNCLRSVLTKNTMQKDYKRDKLCNSATYLSRTHININIIYVDKGDWTLVSLAPHQCLGHQWCLGPPFWKTIWSKWISMFPWTSMKFFVKVYNNISISIFFINNLVGT